MNSNKVFCVGFQKTGTSSLGKALEILGYRVGSYWDFRDYAKVSDLSMDMLQHRAFELAEQYDACKDTPWPILYKELDKRYPNSKFILIIRNTDSWIKSVVSDFGEYDNAIHALVYGVGHPVGHEPIWIERYEKHNAEVQDYFKDRPNDLLILNLNKGEVGWEKNLSLFRQGYAQSPLAPCQ
jgi:Sulfotransferase domain